MTLFDLLNRIPLQFAAWQHQEALVGIVIVCFLVAVCLLVAFIAAWKAMERR